MRFISELSAVLLLATIPTAGMSAQATSPAIPLDSGAIVRVTTMHDQIVGQLLERHTATDSLMHVCTPHWIACTMQADSLGLRTISLSEVVRLETRKKNPGLGGVIGGAFVGGVLGGLMGSSLCESRASCLSQTVQDGGMGALFLGFLGGLIAIASPGWKLIDHR